MCDAGSVGVYVHVCIALECSACVFVRDTV